MIASSEIGPRSPASTSLLELELLGDRLDDDVGARRARPPESVSKRSAPPSRTGTSRRSSTPSTTPTMPCARSSASGLTSNSVTCEAGAGQHRPHPRAHRAGAQDRRPVQFAHIALPSWWSLLAVRCSRIRAPHALGGQRKLVHRHARVGERADDRRRHRRERALAAALGAVGPGAVGVLDDDRASSRPGRSAIRGTRYSSRLSLAISPSTRRISSNSALPMPLQRRALVLALDELRVDRLADVGDGRRAQHADDAGVRVDLDLGARRRRPPRSAAPRRRSRCRRRSGGPRRPR